MAARTARAVGRVGWVVAVTVVGTAAVVAMGVLVGAERLARRPRRFARLRLPRPPAVARRAGRRLVRAFDDRVAEPLCVGAEYCATRLAALGRPELPRPLARSVRVVESWDAADRP